MLILDNNTKFIFIKSSKKNQCLTTKAYKNFTKLLTQKIKLSNKFKVISYPNLMTVSQYSKPLMPYQIFSTSMYLFMLKISFSQIDKESLHYFYLLKTSSIKVLKGIHSVLLF